MKFYYYPETDYLHIGLTEKPSVDSQEIVPCLVVDFDVSGNPVGIDIDHASKFVNLSRLEVNSLPVQALALAA